jgi:hypothetical protein
MLVKTIEYAQGKPLYVYRMDSSSYPKHQFELIRNPHDFLCIKTTVEFVGKEGHMICTNMLKSKCEREAHRILSQRAKVQAQHDKPFCYTIGQVLSSKAYHT